MQTDIEKIEQILNNYGIYTKDIRVSAGANLLKDLSSLLTPEKDGDVADVKREFDVIVNLLIDWNYGTIYKQYDREETTEVLAEDTLKYTNDLWELVKPHIKPTENIHLNSRNLLERFRKFYWDSKPMPYDDFNKVLDEFIESELNPSNKGGMGR